MATNTLNFIQQTQPLLRVPLVSLYCNSEDWISRLVTLYDPGLVANRYVFLCLCFSWAHIDQLAAPQLKNSLNGHHALDVVEIAANILLHLEYDDLIIAMRIPKLFKTIVEGSNTLKKVLWLDIVVLEYHSTRYQYVSVLLNMHLFFFGKSVWHLRRL